MHNTLRFWGVRGSIASPGPHTAGAGGNTACVEVRLGGEHIIIDAGTGIRQLGLCRQGEAMDAWLLLGHLHWDHIQGFPFLGALFDPNTRLRIIGPQGVRLALAAQMRSAHRLLGGLTRPAQSRQQNTDQQCDNRNHHQQFDQRETMSGPHVLDTPPSMLEM